MHRVLVIRLGEVLSEPAKRIEREYTARVDGGVASDVRVAFVDAPPGAVGNLTNPVEVLRERLEEQLLSAMTDLLRLSPGNDEDVMVDVFLLLNFGEPLVANAASVVIEMLNRIVEQNFRAIFPAHRTGPSRRFRIVPLTLLPASADCKRSRDDAVTELAALHDEFEERRSSSDAFPVDRLFLLDAVTGRGIADLEDLVDQVYGFLRLVLFGGLRRSTEFVSLFEAECTDLFASFGIATCEVDFVSVRDTLASRMARRAAQALADDGDVVLPPVTDVLPGHVLEDADRRNRAMEELEDLPLRTLQADGSRALGPLTEFYDELRERVTTWRELESSRPAPANDTTTEPTSGGWLPRASLSLGGALLLGAVVFAVAHFALVLSTAVSALTGGAFAAVAFAVIFLLLRSGGSDATSDEASTVENDDERSSDEAVLDALLDRIDDQASRLRSITTTLERIADSIAGEEPVHEVSTERRTFLEPLVSEALLAHLYESQANNDDVRALADSFLKAQGSWKALLAGTIRPEPTDLEEYCSAHFRELGGQPLFAEPESRECVADRLRQFVSRWREGLSISLEGEAHQQFDMDGFYRVFDAAVIVSEPLAADVGACIREADAVLQTSRSHSSLDDVFVLTAVADIHPDAVAPLRQK